MGLESTTYHEEIGRPIISWNKKSEMNRKMQLNKRRFAVVQLHACHKVFDGHEYEGGLM